MNIGFCGALCRWDFRSSSILRRFVKIAIYVLSYCLKGYISTHFNTKHIINVQFILAFSIELKAQFRKSNVSELLRFKPSV